MTFESERLRFVAIYIWLPPESYVVFLKTLVSIKDMIKVIWSLTFVFLKGPKFKYEVTDDSKLIAKV